MNPARVVGGTTGREAVRCLKRYVAREIYHLITLPDHTTTPAAA
jgi:transposase